jgi:NAD(P)-dependent dehydrogenase (short-subunit alcohol dehydrogenase family)
MKLKGKVALITGAGAGIGRASALLFAKEGAKVVVVDKNEETGPRTVKEIAANGGEAIFVKADVSRADEVRNMVEQAVKRYGRLDILFNNAGITVLKDVLNTTEEDWERCININLKGVFLGCKYAIPQMIKQKGGVIINTASVSGLYGVMDNCPYLASKGGVVLMSKGMALDFAAYNIRVNCLCPSVINHTDIAKEILGDLTEEQRQEMAKLLGPLYPLNRLGEPEEVAAAALFLASDDASYITGVALPIDGGATAGQKRTGGARYSEAVSSLQSTSS